MTDEDKVKAFLDKKNVFAVVGVSEDSAKYGNKVYKYLISACYVVYPVNPGIDHIGNERCYPTLSALPKVPDVVTFVVPPKITEIVLDEADKLKIKKIWMQPGSESKRAIAFCEKHHIQVLHDMCVMIKRRAVD